MARSTQEMSIDLAPNHKSGLAVASPILVGAGAIGYGEAVPRGLELSRLGAAVVGPVLGASRAGRQPPRLAHVSGGAILDTGLQNRGVSNAIQQYGRLWDRLGCPVIVQVAESHPTTLPKVAARLANVPGVHGLELLLPEEIDTVRLASLIRSAGRECEVPLWVKLPLRRAAAWAPAACEAGAAGLVLGQAPTGSSLCTGTGGELHTIRGPLYGPLVFPLMLDALLQVAALGLSAALIACGGIHTLEHVHQALAAGARAVQIDSALWVEPGLANRLAQAAAA